jgi:hypothetical protein
MSERRQRSGRVVGIAEGVAVAVRRRQREREPRVVLYDATGAPRLVAPSAPGYDELLEVAERMLTFAGEGKRESRPRSSSRSGRRSEAADEPDEPAA